MLNRAPKRFLGKVFGLRRAIAKSVTQAFNQFFAHILVQRLEGIAARFDRLLKT